MADKRRQQARLVQDLCAESGVKCGLNQALQALDGARADRDAGKRPQVIEADHKIRFGLIAEDAAKWFCAKHKVDVNKTREEDAKMVALDGAGR